MPGSFSTTVPATSANLGPGYDRLALALNIYLKVEATPAGSWLITTRGEGEGLLETGANNLMARAFNQICRNRGWSPIPLHCDCENPIPLARGLGSSAAAIVSGLALAQLLNIGDIDRDMLLEEAIALEGHPDNVAAAIFGGLQDVSTLADQSVTRTREIAPSISVLLVIPDEMATTEKMRTVVPAQLPPQTELVNRRTVERVLEGLRTGNPGDLRRSEDDQRHQPYRLEIMPTSKAIFEILIATPEVAGAYLSGAGTTVAGWIVGGGQPVEAVAKLLSEQNIPAQVWLVKPDFSGAAGKIGG